MSTTPQPQPDSQPTSLAAESAIRALHAEVKAALSNSGVTVRDRIVSQLVEEEVQKRVKATAVVMDKLEALNNETRKIKPTFAGFDAGGKGVGEPLYTKEQAESLKKNKEQMDKLEAALEKAIVNSDFSKVFELAQK